jgi:hypothetical protein
MPGCSFRWFAVAAGLLLLGIPLSGQTRMETPETEMASPQGAGDGQTHLGYPQDWSSPHLLMSGTRAEDVLAAGAGDPRHVPLGIVSDWTHRHVRYPDSKDDSVMAQIRRDPRWVQNWYLRHQETWWPIGPIHHPGPRGGSRRDWSVPLGTASFEPVFDSSFTFTIGTETGSGTLNLISQSAGTYLATAGTVTVTGTQDIGTFPLYPGGPGVTTSPNGAFIYDNLAYPSSDPTLDADGLLFDNGGGLETNIWGNSAGNYSFYTGLNAGNYPIQITSNGSFTFNVASTPDPGGGQTYPAKFVFDVTGAPSCTNDFVVIGIPVAPGSTQANIVGLNNLYSRQGGLPLPPLPYCAGNGPTVIFAYASGTGQIPASLAISQSGQQLAYIENLAGISYFHVLTIGTTGSNGTGATAAVVPGTGNNAVDNRVLLSPDGGATNQGSTSSPFVVYTPNDANDVAYATTYSTAGSGSGYLYKISNVFNGSATPTLVWSVPINAVPSTPVYDVVSNKVFFTDSNGRIDYVIDTGASPSVFYGPIVASGSTSENPVIVDTPHQMVYASFNSNGSNAVVVQAPTSLASSASVAVGTQTTTYTGPYGPDFNNAWYTGSGTPLMYVAGTDATGLIPTLYSVGFDGSGVMNTSADPTTAALTTGTADSSPITEFYNAGLGKDYIFVGVTDHCIATTGGGTAGCVMSLDITSGFPTVNASSTALAAAGGTSGIIVDNDSSLTEASSIYYATKTGATLVKATQSALK